LKTTQPSFNLLGFLCCEWWFACGSWKFTWNVMMCYLQILKIVVLLFLSKILFQEKGWFCAPQVVYLKKGSTCTKKQHWLMYIIHGSMGRKWVGHLVLQWPQILPNSHETLSKRMMMHSKYFSRINIVFYIYKGYKEFSTIKNI
jgi:hypothetical protein